MEIIMKKVSELIPYEYNAKKHDTQQVDNVANSIKRFGWQQPIVIDENGVVVIGHCRLLAAKKLEQTYVPCTIAAGLSEEEIRELRIADNKTNESEWDFSFLESELAITTFDGFEFDFGLPNSEIDWATVDEVSEKNYEKPESDRLRCPLCNGVDEKIRFKKV